MHYIQGTHTYGIHYATGTGHQLVGYIDFDYVGEIDSHKSTSGYMFHLGSGPICWQSKKKNIVALSSINAKYRGAVNVATEALWLQHIWRSFDLIYLSLQLFIVTIKVLLRSLDI